MERKLNRGEQLFRNWHTTSAVRSRPDDYHLTTEDLADPVPDRWFPPALNAALALEEIQRQPSARRLIIHVSHLVHFLDYTTELELTVVNNAIALMTHGGISQNFTRSDHRAALMLYTDEGYHALFSRQIADQVAEHYCLERTQPMRAARLHQYIAQAPVDFREITEFLIAFVSETIITKELSMLTREQLVSPIFNMLRDHLNDEGRHSIFFAGCFARIIPKLNATEKLYVAQALCEIIPIFCRPDALFLQNVLSDEPELCKDILAALECTASARGPSVASFTLHAIQRTDLLANAHHRRLFREVGLIP
nr:diiron oxygenase [Pseudomonas hunanensis]